MENYSNSEIVRANDEVPRRAPDHNQNCTGGLEEYTERFHLVTTNTDIPIANRRYRISSSSGEIFEGCTDPQGYTERVRTREVATLTLEVFDED